MWSGSPSPPAPLPLPASPPPLPSPPAAASRSLCGRGLCGWVALAVLVTCSISTVISTTAMVVSVGPGSTYYSTARPQGMSQGALRFSTHGLGATPAGTPGRRDNIMFNNRDPRGDPRAGGGGDGLSQQQQQQQHHQHHHGDNGHPDDFTIAIVPDPQYYNDLRYRLYNLYWNVTAPHTDLTHHFQTQMRWIASHGPEHTPNSNHTGEDGSGVSAPIRLVLFMGDLTQSDALEEWAVVKQGLTTLADAGLPFCVVQGDHDLGHTHAPQLPPYFFMKASHRGSEMNNQLSGWVRARSPHLVGTFDGQISNAHYQITIGTMRLVVLSLEFKPRDAVLQWAGGVLSAHRTHTAIVITHSYLNDTNLQHRTTEHPLSDGSNSVEGNSGTGVWSKLVSQHRNVAMVLCGHMDGVRYELSTAPAPAPTPATGPPLTHRNDGDGEASSGARREVHQVHEIMSNFQQWPQGGGGWLRYMTVQPSRDRVAVRTYNPSTGAARLSTGCTSLDLDGPPCKHHDFSFKLCMTEGCTDQQ